jgi:C-terminal processing protease CtpA/Prc
MNTNRANRRGAAALLLCALAPISASAQKKVDKAGQEDARTMLRQVRDTIEKNYYDPSFHGFDLDARFEEAEKKLNDVPDLPSGLSVIAWAVEGLGDSHTSSIPPLRNVTVRSGWQMEMVGENCLLSAVDPHSDARIQGLRPGDRLLQVNGYQPTRTTFGNIKYLFEVLAPQAEYHLLVASPSQDARRVTAKSRLISLPQTLNFFQGGSAIHQVDRLRESYQLTSETRTVTLNDKLMIWKMPRFNLDPGKIEGHIGSARKHDTLILDLRDNSGGGEDSLIAMISNFFDHEITVGQEIERRKSSDFRIPSRGEHVFKDKLFVLVNSASGSAAELFARTIQLQKRGTVIGDFTAGAVGRGRLFPLHVGTSSIVSYAVLVTEARLRLPDGGDLEGTGVKPDILIRPTPPDLAAGRDPVLAAAVGLAGVEMTPEEAGKLFPVIWATY